MTRDISMKMMGDLRILLESYAQNEFKDDRFDCLCPGKVWTFQEVLDRAYQECVVLRINGRDELSRPGVPRAPPAHPLVSYKKGTWQQHAVHTITLTVTINEPWPTTRSTTVAPT